MAADLVKRVYEHKHDLAEGFAKKYGVEMVVWFAMTNETSVAITREKQIKTWNRLWKLHLVDQGNPAWRDLCPDIVG